MSGTYKNPLPFPAADPFVMLAADGRYYLYSSMGQSGHFTARSSDDLVHWRDEGAIYEPREGAWCVSEFWAPECYYYRGKYYLWFSANWRENPNGELENFRIGVAVSDSPTGPFVDLYDRPLFDPGYPIIDANLYFEDDRVYLYYSRCCYKHKVNDCEESWIYGVEVSRDFNHVIGEPVLLLRPEQGWESRSVHTGRRWNEGSFVLKRKDTYYMTYSANFFGENDYAVGYATAKHPLGPYEKAPENPILERKGTVGGTGHNSIVRTRGGELFIVYHGRTEQTGMDRVGFIDRLCFDEQGHMKVSGPTVVEQLAPDYMIL